MSILAGFATLLLFPGFAIAQIYAPACTMTVWNWTFNTLNQSPCVIVAYLEATCSGGVFTVYPLQQPGASYIGPSGLDNFDLCKCNTVTYSLLSACASCQGGTWLMWPEFVFNCTTILPPSTFPNPVPEGIDVPQWALIDVTLEGHWDANKSMAVGDSPEIGSGEFIGSPSFATSSTEAFPFPTALPPITLLSSLPPTTSSPSFPPPSSFSGGSSSNTGAIAGGVVGGVAVVTIAALGFFYLRRRHTTAQPSAFIEGGASAQYNGARTQLLDDGNHASRSMPEIQTHVAPMRVSGYNLNDPGTFHQGQGTSGPRGYNGFPTV